MGKQRKSKTDLLQTGLEILATHGIDRLTIDKLCKKLSVTKGSFYHHFKNQRAFMEALLEFWMEENTERKKTLADESGTPLEQYQRILYFAATLPHAQEKAIRAWAMHDPLVAKYQERVDASRVNYLASRLANLLPDPSQAPIIAQIVLSTMIGSRHMFPAIIGESRHEIMVRLHKLMGIDLPAHNSSTGE